MTTPRPRPPQQPDPATQRRLDALEEGLARLRAGTGGPSAQDYEQVRQRLAVAEARLQELVNTPAPQPTPTPDLSGIEARLQVVEERAARQNSSGPTVADLDTVRERVAALERRPADAPLPTSPPPREPDFALLSRLERVEDGLARQASSGPTDADLGHLIDRLSRLETAPAERPAPPEDRPVPLPHILPDPGVLARLQAVENRQASAGGGPTTADYARMLERVTAVETSLRVTAGQLGFAADRDREVLIQVAAAKDRAADAAVAAARVSDIEKSVDAVARAVAALQTTTTDDTAHQARLQLGELQAQVDVLRNLFESDKTLTTAKARTGLQWMTDFALGATQNFGVFGAAVAAQQTLAAQTNNITSGGTANTFADFTDLTTYANDAATIRNTMYRMGQSLQTVVAALRTYGLLG